MSGLIAVQRGSVAAVLLAVSAAASATPLSAVDGRDVRVTLPGPPKRIVSLSPAVTETLFAIGAGRRVVGVTKYCDYPAEARRLPKIGDYNTSIEKVMAIHPDLIVADVEANRRAIADLTRQTSLKGKVFALRQRSFAELFSAIGSLGRITGCEPGAVSVVNRIRGTLLAVKQRVQRARTEPRVLFVVQTQPLWVAGGSTFISEMIEAAGGMNIGRKAGSGFRSLGIEQLIALDPEVILTTHASPEELQHRPGWAAVTAVRTRRVYVVGFEAVRPCPRLGEAVRRIAALLHPER